MTISPFEQTTNNSIFQILQHSSGGTNGEILRKNGSDPILLL